MYVVGGLYRFEPSKMVEGYKIQEIGNSYDLSNGMAWNKENTKFYFVDFLPKKIYVFDFDANTGVIGTDMITLRNPSRLTFEFYLSENRKTLFEYTEKSELKGHPDGMVTDLDGNIWVACVKGGQLIKIDVATGMKEYNCCGSKLICSIQFHKQGNTLQQ